ncbi:hypothetical protein VHEMI08464 [[Torrubiella] hemipterigena]|uniref:Cell wall protein n=1 Tax=[Torrubiella] hemipterigena TaxID=1531966 RepID=A0A0A1TDL0_9HYPO|nr:hypothetical protein VHEMI08464 [[Torrubiella] hemipterigena]
MKFAPQALVVALAASAQAAVIEVRDLATVRGVIAQVQTGTDNLDAVAKAFNGDTAPVISSSNALITTINNGKTTVQGSSNLSYGDTISLISNVQELKKHAQTLSDDFKASRDKVQQAKACDITRTQIGSIKTAAQALIAAIVSKVPDNAKSIANDQASQITAVLQEAENNFSTTNCVNAP